MGLLRKFTSITSTIKEPDQIAEWVIEQLTHAVSLKQDGLCAAAQYDLTGHVLKRATLFQSRIPEGKIIKLLDLGQYMHLDKMGLDDFDALVIARMSRFINTSLRLLDLNANPDIKDSGAEHVARHSLAHTAIKSLFLSGCGITDSGASTLAASLSRNKDLDILELRKNHITDDGANALAESLLSNTYPRPISLYLSGNAALTDSAAISLAKAAIHRQNLKVWLMECPEISTEAKEEISRYTKNLRF